MIYVVIAGFSFALIGWTVILSGLMRKNDEFLSALQARYREDRDTQADFMGRIADFLETQRRRLEFQQTVFSRLPDLAPSPDTVPLLSRLVIHGPSSRATNKVYALVGHITAALKAQGIPHTQGVTFLPVPAKFQKKVKELEGKDPVGTGLVAEIAEAVKGASLGELARDVCVITLSCPSAYGEEAQALVKRTVIERDHHDQVIERMGHQHPIAEEESADA